MFQILPDDEIPEGVHFLDSKQGEVLNDVFIRDKDYVRCYEHGFESVNIFLSDSGGTGKSHLVKVIYNTI